MQTVGITPRPRLLRTRPSLLELIRHGSQQNIQKLSEAVAELQEQPAIEAASSLELPPSPSSTLPTPILERQTVDPDISSPVIKMPPVCAGLNHPIWLLQGDAVG